MPGRGSKGGREPKSSKEEGEAADSALKPQTSAPRPGSSFNAPTVQDILSDSLTKLSLEYWAPGSQQKKAFDASIIEQIYKDEIVAHPGSTSRLMLLELSFYLEKYVFSCLSTCCYRCERRKVSFSLRSAALTFPFLFRPSIFLLTLVILSIAATCGPIINMASVPMLISCP